MNMFYFGYFSRIFDIICVKTYCIYYSILPSI